MDPWHCTLKIKAVMVDLAQALKLVRVMVRRTGTHHSPGEVVERTTSLGSS